MRRSVCIFALYAGLTGAHAAAPLEHCGICDSSAAVAVGADRFLIANDDDQTMRLYRRDASGPALDTSFNWSKWLDIDGEKKKDEVDFQLLSDDGDNKIDGTICKDYEPKAKRKFRSVTVTVE